MAKILLGKPVADAIYQSLTPDVCTLKSAGVNPTLAIIRAGEREDDISYERSIEKRFSEIGINLQKFTLDENCTQADLLDVIERVNNDENIHGVLMFRPLPNHLDEKAASCALSSKKDIDGITQGSLFGVFASADIGFAPCTASACMEMLKFYEYDLEGVNAVVVGRSLVVGKPVSMMLQKANATVTMCHTRTKNLDDICSRAELLVVCAGHPNTTCAHATNSEQTIIDVGINWSEKENKLVGDVCFNEVEPLCKAISPVPRGVGSVTTAVLAKHTVRAAKNACNSQTKHP